MKKLKTIITFTFTIFIALSLIVVSYMNITYSSKAIEEEAQKYLEALAIENSLIIGNKLRMIELRIDDLSAYVSRTLSKDEIYKLNNDVYIENYIAEFKPMLKYVAEEVDDNVIAYLYFNHKITTQVQTIGYVLDENGHFVEWDNKVEYSDLMTQTENMVWYNEPIIKGKGVWTGPYEDPFLSETLITYSTPVYLDGKIVAIIGMDITFKTLKAIIDSVKVYDSGYAFLLNENLNFIAHPSLKPSESIKTLDNGKYAFMEPIFNSQSSGTIKYFYGTKKIMGYSRLHNGWILAVAPPLEEIFTKLNTTRSRMLLIMNIVIVLSIVISIIIGNWIAKPITELTKAMANIKGSRFDIEIPRILRDNKTEIGRLSWVFEDMRLKLKDSFERIQRNNDDLDKLVTSRTEELVNTNEELRVSIENQIETQDKLVEARKHTALRVLIQNLAHRLNTPVGNAISLSSYLLESKDSKLMDASEFQTFYDEYIEGLKIIYNSQIRISQIVDSLRELLISYDSVEIEGFYILEFIQETTTLHHNAKLHFEVSCDENIAVKIAKKTFESLLVHMIEHSANLSSDQHVTLIKILVELHERQITLRYIDPNIRSDIETYEVFDPYSAIAFKSGSTGMELFIVYDIVMRGLNGSIETSADESEETIIIIKFSSNF